MNSEQNNTEWTAYDADITFATVVAFSEDETINMSKITETKDIQQKIIAENVS